MPLLTNAISHTLNLIRTIVLHCLLVSLLPQSHTKANHYNHINTTLASSTVDTLSGVGLRHPSASSYPQSTLSEVSVERKLSVIFTAIIKVILTVSNKNLGGLFFSFPGKLFDINICRERIHEVKINGVMKE